MKIKKITKVHRRFPDRKWDYKALSARIIENSKPKDITFGKLQSKGKKSQGVEIFSGKNYIVGSNDRSHSRRYSLSKVPNKYKPIVEQLKKKHSKTKWSKRNYMNLN